MIVAFSSSSAHASVALIQPSGALIGSGEEHSPMAASGTCIRLLESLLNDHSMSLKDATLFLADLGPGSFTGVKVGVTLAKSLAFANGVKCGGLSSFDLISTTQTVVFPSKRGEWFVRRPGCDPIRTVDLPTEAFVGFGPGIEEQRFPSAAMFAGHLHRVALVAPELLLPNYLIEPAISQPKKPFVRDAG